MRFNYFRVISFFVIICLTGTITSCIHPKFINVENGQFIKDGSPYYYIGANFWYGAILASSGNGGNRERLIKELNALQDMGVNNLRILVGADGASAVSKIEPSLQTSAGVYNEDILDGLDFLLVEMQKRDMEAVLYLNNSWEWSGGYSQYLEWAGYGEAPVPAVDGYETFKRYVANFVKSDKAQELFSKHVEYIINRTNSYSGIKYTDDPTIFSWQIGNEPRAFSTEGKIAFAQWLASVAKQIKDLDKNHMVSIGSEGAIGCEGDITLWEYIHEDSNIDYLTFHIWPKNWRWINTEKIPQTISAAIDKTSAYISEHIEIADKLNKPLVLEEFGFPRDGNAISPKSFTTYRDKYYDYIFKSILVERLRSGHFAGCNFWAWGGYGSAQNNIWRVGDDYLGDPAQEPQGLNSVFVTDTLTINKIKSANKQLTF